MDDQTFLQAFEDGTLEAFPHRSHVRMAWLYLRQYGWEVGMTRICEGIQHFAAAQGASGKYHETMTRFWAHQVQQAINQTPKINDYEAFLEAHPELLNTRLASQYYTAEQLHSAQARAGWVEPDLQPLANE